MKNRLLGIVAVAVFVALIVFYIKEFDYFNRTLYAGLLARNSAIAGAVIGVIAGFLLARKASSAEDRAPFFFICVFFGALLGPLAGSVSNRLFADQEVTTTTVGFHLEEAYYQELYGFLKGKKKTPAGYRTFFYLDGRLQKIQTRTALFPNKLRGDEVELPLQKGFLGFTFVPLRPS